jgi:hypothetical protein
MQPQYSCNEAALKPDGFAQSWRWKRISSNRRAHEPEMARAILTDYSTQRSSEGFKLGSALLLSIEARHQLLYGFRAPKDSRMSMPQSREDEVGCVQPMPRY